MNTDTQSTMDSQATDTATTDLLYTQTTNSFIQQLMTSSADTGDSQATDTATTDLLYTQTTNSFIQQLMTSSADTGDSLSCSQHQVPCKDAVYNVVLQCLNDGLCCWNTAMNESGCRCAKGFKGKFCETKLIDDDDYFMELLETREKSIFMMTGISTITTLVIGLIAIAAVIAFIVYRYKNRPTQECLERHLSEINEELDRLPAINKLVELTRLTKLFEACTLATAKTAVLYVTDETTRQLTTRRLQPLSAAYTQCLPRWSSAPSILDAHSRPAVDEVDGVQTHIDKRKLQLVFSVDESRVHYQNEDSTRL